MDKRFLLAVALCLFILMFYQSYMGKRQQRWREEQQAAQKRMQETEQTGALPVGGGEKDPGAVRRGEGPPVGFPPPAPARPEIPERRVPCEEVRVDTPLYRAVFCAQDGRLMSWKLKKYRTHKTLRCPVVAWITGGGGEREAGSGPATWVERIHAKSAAEYPLGLELSSSTGSVAIRERLEPDTRALTVSEGDGPRQLVFSGEDASGRKIRRTYTFQPESYRADLQVEIDGLEEQWLLAGLGLRLTERMASSGVTQRYTFAGFMAVIDEHLEKKKKLKDDDDRYFKGNVLWEGFSDKYFLNCVLPRENPVSSVIVAHTEDEKDEPGLWSSRLIYNVQDHTRNGVGRFAYGLYFGPKDLDVLRETGFMLDRSVDLGWFGAIARPLLVVLKFFYRYTHNYGIAIILLTVLIKILFHPLTRKQYESMRELQKLQPKMQEIREKFKNDKEKMNREVMDLYRRHKINPLGGCWPVLLQIPVFIALYRALLGSIELRHAPFMLWIQDLSEKDPCYITPIIMGATMFLQQKMTPMAGDPAQQKIMMFMPLVFTFLFLNFPSGLVLYWLVNNVITIGQQYVSQKRQK